MKARLTLTLALLLICTGAALAQTPDGETPAEETVCDNETGAAFGLCNAYCEAMDCDSADPQASATACTKVRSKFQNVAGHDLPCEQPAGCPPPPPGTACPCVDALPNFAAVLNGISEFTCTDDGVRVFKAATGGFIDATCSRPGGGGRCQYFNGGSLFEFLVITPEEGSACMQLIRDSCTAG